MDKSNQTSVEEQLKTEIDRLNQIVYMLEKENKGLKKKNGKQKHIMSQMSEMIRLMRSKKDQQQYKNVRRGRRR